jgi:hypothetical protein
VRRRRGGKAAPARARAEDVVAFLGPSLPAAEARRIAPCRVLPPARAGDVLALLPERPLAIALVDGLFDTAPSVWHHELLAALDAGVAVFGAASMGALRAAELAPLGVVGVGGVFRAYARGELVDDADVALLHAGAEHGFRAFSVPLVTARAAIADARAARVLSPREASAALRAAGRLHYAARTWPRVLDGARLPAAARARFEAHLPRAPDPKAEDARACVAAAAAFARARRDGAPAPAASGRPLPAHVRRARLERAACLLPGAAAVPSGEVLRALARRPEAGRLAAEGLRRALLAALARSLGLVASPEDADAALEAWRARVGVPRRAWPVFLAACGLDDGAARTLGEDLALEARLLGRAATIVPDGPAWEEGLALAARLTGGWVEEVERRAADAVPRAARRAPRRRRLASKE